MGVDLIRNWNYLEKPKKSLFIYSSSVIVSLALGMSLFSSYLLFLGLMPMIDNFAHIGGFIMGVLMSLIFVPLTAEISRPQDLNWKVFLFSRVDLLLICSNQQRGVALLLVIILYCISYVALLSSLPEDFCPWCEILNCLPVGSWKQLCFPAIYTRTSR